MTLLRIVFILLSLSAIGATSYAAWYGMGAESRDVTTSIRNSSAGAGGIAGRVK